MVEIMSHLHQYAPSVKYTKKVNVVGTGEVEVPHVHLKKILLEGDQLTAARARGAKKEELTHFLQLLVLKESSLLQQIFMFN